MNYYVGPWIWYPKSHHGDGAWGMPVGATGCLDFGSLLDCGTPGVSSGSFRRGGIFSCPDGVTLPSEWAFLGQGDAREIRPTTRQRSSWASLLGYSPQGDTIDAWMLDHLMNGSDPLGLATCKPLMPGRRLELWFDNTPLVRRAFDFASDPYRATMLDVIRRQIRELWEHENSSDPLRPPADTTAMALDYLCKQYRVAKADFRVFVPDDIRNEIPEVKPHRTTVSDEFNRANDTNIGAAWTEVLNDVAVSSNSLTNISAAARCSARYETDLSSSNNYAQFDFVGLATAAGSNSHVGACCRFDSAAESYYSEFYLLVVGGFEGGFLSKVVTGINSDMTSHALVLGIPSVVVKTTAGEGAGSTIKGYLNGVERASVTDTALSSGLRTGVRLRGTLTGGAFGDIFNGGDLAASGAHAHLIGGHLVNDPIVLHY